MHTIRTGVRSHTQSARPKDTGENINISSAAAAAGWTRRARGLAIHTHIVRSNWCISMVVMVTHTHTHTEKKRGARARNGVHLVTRPRARCINHGCQFILCAASARIPYSNVRCARRTTLNRNSTPNLSSDERSAFFVRLGRRRTIASIIYCIERTEEMHCA